MRSDVIRVYKTVHTWTGIVAGLALFIAFYAGAMTMFKDTLSAWVTPPAARTQMFPLSQAPAVIGQTVAAFPAARRQFTLRLEPGGMASLSWRERGKPQRISAMLDTHGHLQTHARGLSEAARFIDVLHMTAGIPGGFSIGMGVMGVVSLVYGLALVSGVIVLLPSLIKDLFLVRVGRNLKRMWLDAHNVAGILSLPFHVVMALSVVAFGLNDYIFSVQDRLIYGGTLDATQKAQNPYFAKAPVVPGLDPTKLLPPGQILAAVKQRAPGFEPAEMSYRGAGEPGATVFVSGDDPRYLARSGGFALLDPVSGSVLNAQFLPGAGGTVWSAATSAFFALHFGSYGGAAIQWAYFFLGLGGAFLFYSGNLIWIESRRKAERRGEGAVVKQRRSTWFMAALTVGVSLGCMAGISATLAAGKLLSGHVADLPAWHARIYYTVFLASIGWAFFRGGARGSVELLAVTIFATLLVPASSLLGWLAPSTGMWFEPSTVGVDIAALAAAACFGGMMRATARRVRVGGRDSVWSRAARAT